MKIRNNINGILLIDKPALLSSNTVLQRVKKLFNALKAGHMGCLDPLATGMLPICFGEATKFSQYGLDADKCYAVTACFGVTTDTGDAQGEVRYSVMHPEVTSELILDNLSKFTGDSLQIPPMYSALKFQGKKLYELARAGKEVPRQPRPITIHQFTLVNFNYPCAQFIVKCSKGTYIRTLIEDLGATLRCGAHVTQLRRLYTAGFEDHPMLSLEECADLPLETLQTHLLPIDSLLQHMPILLLSPAHLQKLYLGQSVHLETPFEEGLVRLYDEQQQFQGLAHWDKMTATLQGKRLFARPE